MGAVKPTASLILNNGKPYKPAFYRGLEKLGYTIIDKPLEQPEPGDLLVLWNRIPAIDKVARTYEERGADVLIAENGWVGKDTYALSLNNHNGAGTWRVGDESRWPSFGIEVKPWRSSGEKILVVPQRGIGVPPAAMPRDWPQDILARLQRATHRPIEVRLPQDRIHPFEPCLKDCHAVVTWASGAGIKALIEGYPVFHEMPQWIGQWAARPGIGNLEQPYLGERDTFLHKLSWAMWRLDEIDSGEALGWLLSR